MRGKAQRTANQRSASMQPPTPEVINEERRKGAYSVASKQRREVIAKHKKTKHTNVLEE